MQVAAETKPASGTIGPEDITAIRYDPEMGAVVVNIRGRGLFPLMDKDLGKDRKGGPGRLCHLSPFAPYPSV